LGPCSEKHISYRNQHPLQTQAVPSLPLTLAGPRKKPHASLGALQNRAIKLFLWEDLSSHRGSCVNTCAGSPLDHRHTSSPQCSLTTRGTFCACAGPSCSLSEVNAPVPQKGIWHVRSADPGPIDAEQKGKERLSPHHSNTRIGAWQKVVLSPASRHMVASIPVLYLNMELRWNQ
jgi:hypothetical protein